MPFQVDKKLAKTPAIFLCLFIIFVVTIGAALFSYSESVLKQYVRQKSLAAVRNAVLIFEYDEANLRPNQVEELNLLADKLKTLIRINPNTRYAYILRRIDHNKFEFVVDAYSFDKMADDEDPPLPGDEYDASEYPVLAGQAIFGPSVDKEIQPDQWGAILAAYAPIKSSPEAPQSDLVLGMDTLVDDYQSQTRVMLWPFIVFIFLLVVLVISLYLLLAKIWQERIVLMQRIDRQKDELLSIVAHQLATPVTAMKWSAEELIERGENLTADQKDSANTIQQQAHQLNDLITMILDVSRIQLGKIPIKKKPVPLDEFFEEILQVIRLKAHERGVKLQVSLPIELPTASIDYRYTRMAVENLLSNAVKYTPKDGSVEFEVRIHSGRMRIRVKDTGCGIPAADQAKIFGKMFRASNVVGNIDGNGFGLYVAKGSTEAQGGSIGFTSEEGKGTEFWIELPVG